MDQNERQWGMLCHLAALLQFVGTSLLLGNIVGPLIVWLIKKEEYRFVDEQGKESLNFQISMTIYTWLASLLLGVTCMWILIPVVALVLTAVNLIFVILAAMKAGHGEGYQYPLTIRFLK